jgi:sugar transferase EpsL
LTIKRVTDLTVIFVGLPLWLPVLIALSGLVRLRLGKPVFFVQERLGLNGVPFRLIKFRTMSDSKDASGSQLSEDERSNRFGKWLRSLSLDEIPQLFNVLKGEMSLVGPRPLLTQYLDRYTPRQARRNEIRPGITGWAQVNGRNAISWEEKFELDVWYVEHQSVPLDLKILFLTLLQVFRREGISAPGSVSSPEFLGSKASRH